MLPAPHKAIEKTQVKAGRPRLYPDENTLAYISKSFVTRNIKKPDYFPTLESLALHLDLDLETISDYQKRYPKFDAIVKKLLMYQRNYLITRALIDSRKVNPTMAIFLLKALHSLIETERVEVTGAHGGPIQLVVFGKHDPVGKIQEAKIVDNSPKPKAPRALQRPKP